MRLMRNRLQVVLFLDDFLQITIKYNWSLDNVPILQSLNPLGVPLVFDVATLSQKQGRFPRSPLEGKCSSNPWKW
jgi:hypothetical protein